ncbi:NAD-dependent deacylase [Thalassococcus lentus]|uniref:NAD-dependent protein deacylase n=1 Tax=Thalassococcus lentus TaxID=1210524 RepID=A0ABT4XUY9_9RHOB|nr:NAD-dependent deacylase [Thalassococcus lentus]MDA7425769.1 NAD-dependent deacylase [Thalassococcus lentus]
MADKIVILTGAGLSAESGLGTFRDEGGLWAQHKIEDVATPEGFQRNPDLVHAFYNARRKQAAEATPNAAHVALANLQEQHKGEVVIVTQNVDGLHEAAGGRAIHMHGVLDGALCAACGHRWPAPAEMATGQICPACSAPTARPDIVWFGEIPYHMEQIADHLQDCDLFVSIGTSGQVYPAAGFVQESRMFGASTLEINLERTDTSGVFDRHIVGPATQTVPAWVSEILG